MCHEPLWASPLHEWVCCFFTSSRTQQKLIAAATILWNNPRAIERRAANSLSHFDLQVRISLLARADAAKTKAKQGDSTSYALLVSLRLEFADESIPSNRYVVIKAREETGIFWWRRNDSKFEGLDLVIERKNDNTASKIGEFLAKGTRIHHHRWLSN